MDKKLKILVSCYACSPSRGSEPGMGWSFVNGISKTYEVHVITEKEKWENEIKTQLAKEPNSNLNFYFIQKKRNRKLRKIWPPSYYWFYRIWQKKALKLAKNLDSKENFDAVHQLNMVGYREPGYLWKIEKPFVWGPIGGTQNVPWHIFSILNMHGKVFYGGRNLINSFQKKYLRRPKLAAKRSMSRLIAATPDVQKDILNFWGESTDIITEVGTTNLQSNKPSNRKESEPLKIIWSGQHTSGKALHILLKSLVKLPTNVNWSLDVLGVGKETKNWKSLAHKLNISEKCNWHGWLQKNDALKIMQNGHVFCITSIKDLTASVTLESLSLGLPIICLDHCGFSYVVDDSCGIKINISNPKTIYTDFSSAISTLNNEDVRIKLAKGALKRAQEFTWKKKIEKLNGIYNSVINENSNCSQ